MNNIENPCRGCESSCCDHFILAGWTSVRIAELIHSYPFLYVDETFEYNDHGDVKTAYVMECSRLMRNGDCFGYPDNRPKFCAGAGVNFAPGDDCKLFEMNRHRMDRSE